MMSPGKWLQRLAPTGGMVRAALLLGSATAATQAIAVLLAPVYSRLYTPADYGVFGVYNSIIATALTIGCLCYETGIPICEDDQEAAGLTSLSVVLVFLRGLGVAAVLGARALLGVQGNGYQLGWYSWLIPVGIIGAGVYRALRYWALRRKNMGAIARTAGSQLISSTAINLGFGILSPSPLGLILAAIAGYSSGVWGLARRTELLPCVKTVSRKPQFGRRLWTLAKKYRRLPLIGAPSTLFNSLGLYLPGILLAPYFGADFAGQFLMGMKMVSLPVGLIGGALSQVFFSSAAAVAREQPHEMARFFHRVFIRGAACSLLILLVGLVAPWVVPFALGEKWRPAGEIVLWLSLLNAVGLTVSSLSVIPNIVGRLQGQFIIDVARALAVFLLLFLGHRAGLSGMAVVKGYTLVMIVNYLACYCLYSHQVKQVARTGLTGWNEPTASP